MHSQSLWFMDLHSRAAKKNTSHGNEVLPQDTRHLIQRSCYQQGSVCQDPAGNRITRRPPDHPKRRNWSDMGMSSVHQVWPKSSCEAQKTRQTEKEVDRQYHEMDITGVCQVPEGSGEQRKVEKKTGCEVICGAPVTPTVQGLVKVKVIAKRLNPGARRQKMSKTNQSINEMEIKFIIKTQTASMIICTSSAVSCQVEHGIPPSDLQIIIPDVWALIGHFVMSST